MEKVVIFCIILISLNLFADNLSKKDFFIDTAILETDSGKIRIGFFKDIAPKHIANFSKLIKSGFYDGVKFHRVIKSFIIQAGDPMTKKDDYPKEKYGSQSFGTPLSPEIKKIHFKGAVAAARIGDETNPLRNSSPSQFYIALYPLPDLDGKYTVFGRVIEGFDIVTKISKVKTDKKDIPFKDISINKTYMEKYFDEEKYNKYKREESKK